MSSLQHQPPTPSDLPSYMDQEDESPGSYIHHSTTWTPMDSMTPISTNPSRKRSRDETTIDKNEDGSYFPSQQINTPAPIPEEPIYGEGMVLLNPVTGMSISAESQTGTWYEEKAAEEEAQKPVMPVFKPKMPSSRKSMRLSQSSIRAELVHVLATAPASPPKTASTHPEIDEATLTLGIGWTKLASEDENIQIAARGWARYLENHYDRYIHGAEILLKSSGLNAYLVGCQEGFYLFSESLLEGRLVGRSWESCLQNLQSQPMTFDGEQILKAERTPGPEGRQFDQSGQEKMENWADYDRLNGVPEKSEPIGGGMDLD